MKKKFDWDRFLNTENEICVHCKTEDEANDFCKQMDKHGMKWDDGELYRENTMWHKYNSDIAYFNNGTFARASFAYDKSNYEVLEWSDYMKKKIFSKSDLENGMIIETREPCLYLVLDGRAIGKKSYISLDGYNDDLSCKDTTPEFPEFDIKKVYSLKRVTSLEKLMSIIESFNKTNLELIYGKKIISKEEAEKLLEELTDEEYEIECD